MSDTSTTFNPTEFPWYNIENSSCKLCETNIGIRGILRKHQETDKHRRCVKIFTQAQTLAYIRFNQSINNQQLSEEPEQQNVPSTSGEATRPLQTSTIPVQPSASVTQNTTQNVQDQQERSQQEPETFASTTVSSFASSTQSIPVTEMNTRRQREIPREEHSEPQSSRNYTDAPNERRRNSQRRNIEAGPRYRRDEHRRRYGTHRNDWRDYDLYEQELRRRWKWY